MTLALATLLVLAINALLCGVAYVRSVEAKHGDALARLDEVRIENAVLVEAVAGSAMMLTDTQTVVVMLKGALRHSLNGDADSAWAILGELGDTKR